MQQQFYETYRRHSGRITGINQFPLRRDIENQQYKAALDVTYLKKIINF
jgi:hypothetical protein